MMMCPRGCDAFLEYVGIDDGFGMDGEMVCELWECPACGEQVVGDCFDSDVTNIAAPSWEQLAVDEILAEEEPDFDDDDTKPIFPF